MIRDDPVFSKVNEGRWEILCHRVSKRLRQLSHTLTVIFRRQRDRKLLQKASIFQHAFFRIPLLSL